MLASRGMVRSLPSGGARGLVFKASPASASSRISNGRQFGTALRRTGTSLNGTASLLRPRTSTAATTTLGGVASSRNLSLWGYGSAPKQVETPAPPTELTPEPAVSAASAPPPTTNIVSPPPAVDAPIVPTEATLPDLTDLILAEPDILNMPENIGYLKALGLDYGWGFTSTMQWLLEHIHVYTGLGWGASIVAAGLIIRGLMIYPSYKAAIFTAKMGQVQSDPRTVEAKSMVSKSYRSPNGQEEIIQARYLQQLVMKEYGVSNVGFLWGFLPLPFSFGFFRLLNGMNAIPVPGMETGGFLWFTNLTVADPYYILPLVSMGLLALTMRLNQKYTPVEQRAQQKKLVMVFGGVGFFITAFLSAGINLMAASLGAATYLTTAALNNATIRRSLGMEERPVYYETAKADAPVKPVYEAPRATGLQGIKERLTENLSDAQKGFKDKMEEMTGVHSGSADDKKAQKQHQDRQHMLKQTEEKRKQQQREEFERKWKQNP